MVLGLAVLVAFSSSGYGGGTGVQAKMLQLDRERVKPAYLAVVDLRNANNDGVLLGVDRRGAVTEILNTIGGDSVVRSAGRAGFLVGDRRGDRVIHIGMNGMIEGIYPLGPGGTIRDVLSISRRTVWITRALTNTITVLDLVTGKLGIGTDLTVVLEDEAVADPEMMHLHDGLVYVQLQRLNDEQNFSFALQGAIGVIDVASGALVDAVETEAGVQPVRLVGPVPHQKMHVTPDGSALLVSASGPRLYQDVTGGLERIEIATLSSSGLVVNEDLGDFGASTPITGDLGIGIFHTDIIESSHVIGFSTKTMMPVSSLIFEELFVIIESIQYDHASGLMLMPGFDGAMNEYDPVTGMRTRRVLYDNSPGYIRDFALMRR